MTAHRLALLAAPEVRALAAAGAPALWAIGSTEQHGTHLVTGFDLASAQAVCDRAAERCPRDVALLPGLPFGSSDHWLPLGATWSLSPTTLVSLVSDVARSAAAAGFQRLTIVNGHAGNIGPAVTAVGGLVADTTVVEFLSYWTLVDPERIKALSPSDGGGVGHAGEVETSIALYLGGLAVDERLPAPAGKELSEGPGSSDPIIRAPRPLTEAPSGVYGNPTTATRELGELMIEAAADRLAAHLTDA
ncbi:MAG: creatininase family protein [Thermoleophilia bacterium]|jgi:creatinine amidohydrolase|nr:creatininase family protein [Thermoleophilia bacterium]